MQLKYLFGLWGYSSKIWMRSYRTEGAVVVEKQRKDCFLTHIPSRMEMLEWSSKLPNWFLLGKVAVKVLHLDRLHLSWQHLFT